MHSGNRSFWIKSLLIFLLSVSTVSHKAKANDAAEEYIQKYKRVAISEMKKHGIPASIKLAQGLLESGAGKSRLAVQGNNHFGIKCHLGWTGRSMKHTDDAVDECFRVYDDPNQSFLDHSQFLSTRSRYANLFKLKTNDYKGWAHGLKAAGYATNPQYAYMLIDVIERYQLFAYDMDLTDSEIEAYRHREAEREKGKIADLPKNGTKIEPNGSPTISTEAKFHLSTVFYNNNVKVVRLQKNETLEIISKRFSTPLFKLKAYNDLSFNQELSAGDLVYLAPKKNKAKKKTHLVLKHENLWGISQNYGVKLKKLYKRNLLSKGEEPQEGTTLYLRKKAKKKPKLRIISEKELKEEDKPDIKEIKEVPDTNQVKADEGTEGEKTEARIKPTEAAEIEITDYHPFTIRLNYTDESQDNRQLPADAKLFYHIVTEGDTLYNISKKYKITVEQLKSWNNLEDNSIQLNQQLIILQ